MKRKIGHSIKALTQQQGGALAPLLGRGWGRLLVLAVLLLAANGYAYAQVNTAAEPYLNSWHKYEVTMGDGTNNTYRWNIYNNSADANSDLGESSPNRFLLDGEAWVKNIGVAGGVASIEIFFDESIFTDASTWYLVFSEISNETGACVARRSFTITIRDNNFYFTLPADDSECNSLEGEILDGDDVTGKMNSEVQFTISMHKDADHLVDNWEVTGQISFAGAASYLTSDVTFEATGTSDTRSESWVLTDNTNGNFTLALDCFPDDAPYPDDEVTITVYIYGYVYETVDVTLTLSNGMAYSGTTYTIVTDDNLNKGSGDRAQTITKLNLTATPNLTITYN